MNDPYNTSRRVSLEIPRDTDYLSLVRRTVTDLAEWQGFDALATAEIEMAVDEAASNAIRHAGCALPISLEASVDDAGITVTVRDGGAPFEIARSGRSDAETRGVDDDAITSVAASVAEALDGWRAVPREGGLGVLIIRRFMDEVECRHRPETGNELRMRRYLCAAAAAETATFSA